MATLYIVATPIGNLEDITLRALRILKEVDVVLCEDTRVTRKLLSHYGIQTKTESYHSQSTFSKVEKILGMLFLLFLYRGPRRLLPRSRFLRFRHRNLFSWGFCHTKREEKRCLQKSLNQNGLLFFMSRRIVWRRHLIRFLQFVVHLGRLLL